ncbi:MAG: hypothetical protein KIS78_01800 [Labilithrix sp.]|nr:hypothetical protein [Labilithrix sp.]MCW5831175.1 hypothetical protein [Labilithrix sp.]
MSPISNVSANASVSYATSFTADPSAASLTPGMLLVYCTTRLQTIDQNIAQYFVEQERRNDHLRSMNNALNVLQSGTWGGGHEKSENIVGNAFHQQNHADKANEIRDVWLSTDNPEVRAACAEAFRSVSGLDVEAFAKGRDVTAGDIEASAAAGKIHGVGREQWTARVDALKNHQSDLMKSGELDMIKLQSLVSQRQLAVQLTTQLMQTLNETSKQVVGNLR